MVMMVMMVMMMVMVMPAALHATLTPTLAHLPEGRFLLVVEAVVEGVELRPHCFYSGKLRFQKF